MRQQSDERAAPLSPGPEPSFPNSSGDTLGGGSDAAIGEPQLQQHRSLRRAEVDISRTRSRRRGRPAGRRTPPPIAFVVEFGVTEPGDRDTAHEPIEASEHLSLQIHRSEGLIGEHEERFGGTERLETGRTLRLLAPLQ